MQGAIWVSSAERRRAGAESWRHCRDHWRGTVKNQAPLKTLFSLTAPLCIGVVLHACYGFAVQTGFGKWEMSVAVLWEKFFTFPFTLDLSCCPHGIRMFRLNLSISLHNQDWLLYLTCAQVEEGWWSGTLNGKSGLFPSNFVKELEPMGDVGESNDTSRADDTGKNLKKWVQLNLKTFGVLVFYVCLGRLGNRTWKKAGKVGFYRVEQSYVELVWECFVLNLLTLCNLSLVSVLII